LKSVMSYYQIMGKSEKVDPLGLVLDNGITLFMDEDYCTNPTCDCTDVLLRFFDTGDGPEDAIPVFSFRLDLETRKVTEKKVNNKKIRATKLIGEFINALDDETMDRFRLHLSQAKQYGRKHYLDYLPKQVIDGVLNGYIIPYVSVFGSGEMGVLGFQYDSDDYFVVDYYCVDPKCSCQDAHLQFIKINHRKGTQDAFFNIVLELPTYQYTIKEMHCKPEDVENLVKYVIRNKEMLRVLKRHCSEMKAASREIMNKYEQKPKQDQPRLVATGRNDPCPCGSGKKYKHCCLKSMINR